MYSTAKLLFVTETPAAIADEITRTFNGVADMDDGVQIDVDSIEENLCDLETSYETHAFLNEVLTHNDKHYQADIIQFIV